MSWVRWRGVQRREEESQYFVSWAREQARGMGLLARKGAYDVVGANGGLHGVVGARTGGLSHGDGVYKGCHVSRGKALQARRIRPRR